MQKITLSNLVLGGGALRLLLLALLFPTALTAQRAPRTIDIGQMTQQEQEDLADHIRDFLIGHSHIITDHVDNFDTGIHFTTNFLPWHRVHVRELEDYIQTLLNQEDQWLA